MHERQRRVRHRVVLPVVVVRIPAVFIWGVGVLLITGAGRGVWCVWGTEGGVQGEAGGGGVVGCPGAADAAGGEHGLAVGDGFKCCEFGGVDVSASALPLVLAGKRERSCLSSSHLRLY